MLNGRAIPFGILCVLSITSTVFAQSQSATDTIIEKIYQSRIWYGILGILGTLIVSIAGYFLRSWRQNRGNKDNMDAVDRLADQIARAISAQAEISATRNVPGHPKAPRLEGLDELTDDIRSTHHEARETV